MHMKWTRGFYKNDFFLFFCLKLPQSSYDTSSGGITSIDTPIKPPPADNKSPLGTNIATQFAAAAGTSDASSITATTTTKITTPITSGLTPKITQLLGLNSGGSSSVINYFGPMSFFDDQKYFVSVFGNRPQLLGTNTSRLDTRDIGDKLRSYTDKCMFDVFLTICKE